jgi:hypothetical protein
MKVSELIAELQDLDQDMEILIAYQPSWPLQVTVSGVHQQEDDPDCCEDPRYEGGVCTTCGDKAAKVYAYVVAGSAGNLATPYAPKEVFG